MKKYRVPLLVGIFIGVLAVVVRLYWPTSTEKEARSVLAAALANDTDTLYYYSPAEERASCHLTKENFSEAWRQLIEPRLALYRTSSRMKSHLLGGGHEGNAFVQLTDSGGRTGQLAAPAFEGDDHGVTPILSTFLMQAWRLDYYARHDVPATPLHSLDAVVEGIETDRPTLEKLGIPGVFRSSRMKFESWDELEARFKRFRDEEAAGLQPSVPPSQPN